MATRARKRPLPSPFDDCLALVSRADVHLKALDGLFDRFLKSDAYRISSDVDEGPVLDAVVDAAGRGWRDVLSGPATPRDVVLIGHVRKPPPSRAAGLLISDAINNLRAALDHAVWRLSTRSAPPPDPLPKEWREVGWPVVLDAKDWTSSVGSRLKFVRDPEAREQIKALQPFSRRQRDPRSDEFAVLHELWNVHKHRHLPLTQVWVGIDKMDSMLNRATVFDAPPGYADDLRRQIREHAYVSVGDSPRRAFEDGAVLGRYREARPPYSWAPEIHMHAYLAVEIAFPTGPPAYGSAVQDTLRSIRDEVAVALEALKPFA